VTLSARVREENGAGRKNLSPPRAQRTRGRMKMERVKKEDFFEFRLLIDLYNSALSARSAVNF
jgi:hypothetical protein